MLKKVETLFTRFLVLAMLHLASITLYAASVEYQRVDASSGYDKQSVNKKQPTQYRNYQLKKNPAGESDYLEAEQYRLSKQFKRAEPYFLSAARKGYGMAHFRLGQMYSTGRGSVRSLVEAHMHYNLSSYLGVDEGRKAMLILEQQMTNSQLEKAMRRAVGYRKQHNL